MLTPNPYNQRWLYQGISLTERFPKFGCDRNNQREFVCDSDAESLCLSDIWPYWFGVILALYEICPCQFRPINLVNLDFNYIYTQQKKLRKSQKTMQHKNTKANNYSIFIYLFRCMSMVEQNVFFSLLAPIPLLWHSGK